jgi:hypothetical protein
LQVFHPKRYRFFYPAGLISLVLLPLLGCIYLYSKPVIEQQYVMEVNTISPESQKRYPDRFPDPLELRQYQKIFLSGNKTGDSIKLLEVQGAIHSILTKKDTVNGIQIVFGPKAKYFSLVQSLNICLMEEAKTWTIHKNNFLVLYRNPTKQVNFRSFCGTPEIQRYYDRLFREEKELQYKKLHPAPAISLAAIIKTFWPSSVLLLIMVSLNIKKVRHLLREQPTI